LHDVRVEVSNFLHGLATCLPVEEYPPKTVARVPFSVRAALGNPLWATSTDGKDKMMDIKIPHFRILSLLD
jgi:hypothetical protein